MAKVNITFDDAVAVLTIDHPPVNAGTAAQRAALSDALTSVAAEPGLRGVVIRGAGRHFYAGSDLKEFDGPLVRPRLPDIIRQIEQLPVPVVAAISGLALGGGLELALACDVRIADPTARVGFPEVQFGILPGAGGTVRTPRLVGVAAAIDLVTSARQVPADEALELGLVDSVVPAERLVDEAVRLVRGRTGRTLARETPVPPADETRIEAALADLPRRARPNVRKAAEMVRRAAELDVDTALAEERALFDELRQTEESQNLRYLFFARKSASKGLRAQGTARDIRTVGVVGAGTMGAALARLFAVRGLRVWVVDTNAAALERLEPPVTTSQSLTALGGADLVVDAVFEDMVVKQKLLAGLEPIVRADTVLASNTSYLDLDEMSSVLRAPARFAGLHFFNPPDRNPLVEVIRASATDDDTAATLGALVARLGKSGIPAGLGDGFVANRVYADYRTQAEFLVEDGASPEQVDAAMVAFGMAIGPFAVADMSGLDIAWARRKRLAPTRDPRQRYVAIADRLCEEGRFGRKTGAGWFRYPDGARRGEPDPHVERVIDDSRRDKGIVARPVPDEEIQQRVLGSMVAAAARIVVDGVARRATDVDVAMTEGFAFPKALGGPLRAFARKGRAEMVETLAAVHRSCPVTFAILEPAARGEVPPEVADVLEQVKP